MARVKLKELDLKLILSKELNLPYHGIPVNKQTSSSKLTELNPLVIKVDQGIKKRGIRGLLKINVTPSEAIKFVNSPKLSAYSSFIAEPFIEHESSSEKYLSLERTRYGWKVLFNEHGGIDIEDNWDSVLEKTLSLSDPEPDFGSPALNSLITKLISLCDKYYLSFLELNPFILEPLTFLDAAAEIDSDALPLLKKEEINLKPVSSDKLSKAELKVKDLDSHTPASLKLKILNPNGSLWMLLSGGGASLVLADEIADLGAGELLANYGEYSGSPSTDDTREYTLIILDALLQSKANNIALVIAGGVANFTDVAKTFKGIIQALEIKKSLLVKKGVRVFIRRGGPNQEKGLTLMKDFLEPAGLLGVVEGSDYDLPRIASDAIKYVKGSR